MLRKGAYVVGALATRRVQAGAVKHAPIAALSTAKPSGDLYSERMAKTGRPLSPHVSIYAFPLYAISSVTVRVTGVALSGGLAGVSALGLFGGDPAALMSWLGHNMFLTKAVFSFPLIYHYLGGVRHWLFDHYPDQLLTNRSIHQSTYLIFGASAALSLAAGMVTLDESEKQKQKK